jgi:hypothetical protein
MDNRFKVFITDEQMARWVEDMLIAMAGLTDLDGNKVHLADAYQMAILNAALCAVEQISSDRTAAIKKLYLESE